MRKKKIFHIYAGTSGLAGLYIHSIYLALYQDFEQDVFVNYYYPFNYGRKYFYRFSELSFTKFKNNKIRKLIRFFEQLVGLSKTFIIILSKKPDYLNYSLTSDTIIEYLFLKLLLFCTKTSILITCHDVKPFSNNLNEFNIAIIKKKKFFLLAKKLIVHNENSKNDLKQYYNIEENITIFFPFPVMDLNEFILLNPKIQLNNSREKIFLFIGHLRKSKGIGVLIDAWNIFYKPELNCKLIIAGNNAFNDNIIINKIEQLKIKNCEFIKKFLSDNEYCSLINMADFIVLPYIEGTNSGIPSSVISLDKIVITSNIEMFNNLSFIQEAFKHQNEDPFSLKKLFDYCLTIDENKYKDIVNKNKELLKTYRDNFQIKIIHEFLNL